MRQSIFYHTDVCEKKIGCSQARNVGRANGSVTGLLKEPDFQLKGLLDNTVGCKISKVSTAEHVIGLWHT